MTKSSGWKTQSNMSAPSKSKSGRFNMLRVMKTKFPATVMVFGVVSSEGHIMPLHIFEVGLKVNTKVYLDVAWSLPSAEYSLSPRRLLWKRHAPSSGSVSRRWFRLKAATLNRCQLCYIFSYKSFKIKL